MVVKKRKKSYPDYKIHKASARAYVWFNGKRSYLGAAESPESYEAYNRFIADLAANQGRPVLPADPIRNTSAAAPGKPVLIAHLMAAFLTAHQSVFSEKEFAHFRHAFRELRQLHAHTPVEKFGPRSLKLVREAMIEADLSRNVINKRIGRIKRLIKWGCSEELVPASVFHALQSVDGLRRGQSKAREREPVAPAPLEHIEALLQFLSPPLAAMVQVQYLAAMRPSEVCMMRVGDIDTSSEVWLYRPQSHKGTWREKDRIIAFGPKAVAVLKPFMDKPQNAYLFSSAESATWYQEQKHKQYEGKRKTPKYPSEARNEAKRKAKRHARKLKRQPGECYDKCSYNRALKYAFGRAAKAGMPIPEFFPYQLRHARATHIRATHGLEVSQLLLGHARCDVTQVYAQRDFSRLIEVAKETG